MNHSFTGCSRLCHLARFVLIIYYLKVCFQRPENKSWLSKDCLEKKMIKIITAQFYRNRSKRERRRQQKWKIVKRLKQKEIAYIAKHELNEKFSV